MITSRAVKQFLARPRRDFRVYKTFSEEKLQDKADRLPIAPPIWSKLNHDQKVCFVIGAKMRRFCFWADTGTGKTFLSIALSRYFQREGSVKRSLVLVPAKINKYEWAREIRKHSPKSTFTILEGSSEQKWKQLEESDTQLVVETYAGLVRMVSSLVTVTKGKRKTNKLKLHAGSVNALCEMFQGIFLDESIFVVLKKRHGSLMHRICRKISQHAEIAFALNGTPHGRDPTDLWGQMRIIDHGETLGETLGLFRAAFFIEKKNYWGGFEYTFNKKMQAELNRVIANRSIRIKADESSLPAVVPIVNHVILSDDAQEIYDRVKNELIAAHGNFREQENAFLRMRQISSGFVGYHDDELGKRAKFEFQDNPKLDLLLSLVDRVQQNHKSVIFHDFVFSGSMIGRELEKMGIGFVRLWGSKENPEAILRRFDDDDKVRVFILNNHESYGLNLQVAQYGFYYESPVPVIKRKQSQRRIERQHSKFKRVFIYDLVVRGTVDQRILDFHAEGRDIFEAVIEGKNVL